MLEANIQHAQAPLQADLDQIAEDIVGNLKADLALLSFTHNTKLVSIGLSNSAWVATGTRTHNAQDMICMHTRDADAPLRIPDTRKVPAFDMLNVVSSGLVIGYLGVPIHNAEVGAVGVVCAGMNAPRVWTDAEENYLRAMSRTVEQIILKEMYRIESQDANQVLNEYDQIISAFSMVRAAPTSIHDHAGKLVFANRAISSFLSDAELHSPEVMKTILAPPYDRPVPYRSMGQQVFDVSRHLTSGNYLVCQWDPAKHQLN